MTFTYTVTNPGNVPLQDVLVTDNRCAPVTYVRGDNGDDILQPGETWIYTCTSNLTATTTNIATATAHGGTTIARDTDAVTVQVAAAAGDPASHPTPMVTLPPTDIPTGHTPVPTTGGGLSVLLLPGLLGLAAAAYVLWETRRRRA